MNRPFPFGSFFRFGDKLLAIRVNKFLEMLTRVEKAYGEEENIPGEFYAIMDMLRNRLNEAKERAGKSVIPPSEFSGIEQRIRKLA